MTSRKHSCTHKLSMSGLSESFVGWLMLFYHGFIHIANVGITTINHPPVTTIDSWYVHHSQSFLWSMTLLYTHEPTNLSN